MVLWCQVCVFACSCFCFPEHLLPCISPYTQGGGGGGGTQNTGGHHCVHRSTALYLQPEEGGRTTRYNVLGLFLEFIAPHRTTRDLDIFKGGVA